MDSYWVAACTEVVYLAGKASSVPQSAPFPQRSSSSRASVRRRLFSDGSKC